MTFEGWIAALEARHLAELRFPEVTRALRALSADYVQRRHRVGGAALDGRGKRAAFALFYGPLHFIVIEEVSRSLGIDPATVTHVIDLGCGTGAAGAAIASATGARPLVTGTDRQAWTLTEAAATYRWFALRHRVIRSDVSSFVREHRRAGEGHLFVAAYTINELSSDERRKLLAALIARGRAGAAVLVIEPIATRVSPWWDEWAQAWRALGGRADTWRFARTLPETLRKLDEAAGLDHREQTARSIWLPAGARR
ncbi:MAG TPA: methyltransferase [Vicinamibacterales bacterium]|nr:methyltransferase [Vicinamibacterales bacterium]